VFEYNFLEKVSGIDLVLGKFPFFQSWWFLEITGHAECVLRKKRKRSHFPKCVQFTTKFHSQHQSSHLSENKYTDKIIKKRTKLTKIRQMKNIESLAEHSTLVILL
jgi:hypothetical protein